MTKKKMCEKNITYYVDKLDFILFLNDTVNTSNPSVDWSYLILIFF